MEMSQRVWRRSWKFSSPGESKVAVLFFYSCTFLWGYPTYLFWIMPLSFNTLWNAHATFLLGNALMWFLFLKASMMNPGLLPQHTDEYYQAIRQVYMAAVNYCRMSQNNEVCISPGPSREVLQSIR
ncbi:Hypothetical predicted protein [Podarcis lilfordi]|uniref:Uncharacterized protein n=1 Tax=Podarcis lilfordi TaxID=74358 RepID=A0AA35KVL0_9SAUR|nr:Hypothetical predicted protein [Podarcis lilfordi]